MALQLGSGPGCLWSHWLSSPRSPQSPGKAQSHHWASRPWLSPGTSGSCWSAQRWSRPREQSTGGRVCSQGRPPSTLECTCHSVDPRHPQCRHNGRWTGHTVASQYPWGRSHRLEGREQCQLIYQTTNLSDKIWHLESSWLLQWHGVTGWGPLTNSSRRDRSSFLQNMHHLNACWPLLNNNSNNAQ